MVLGDLRPGVALFHLVGDLGGLGAVQGLRQIPQVHDLIAGDILLLDLHAFGKVAGDGVLIGAGGFQLL